MGPRRRFRRAAQRRDGRAVGIVIAKDAMTVDEGVLAGAAVTALVTMELDVIESRIGSAFIAGIHEPISAGTARRMAAKAKLIPFVLGGKSEVLDVGVSRRLHSPGQRAAMAVRDGGCIWPGCLEPPSRCEAAHVDAARDFGPTSVANGCLLCAYHHHRFDLDGWALFRDLEGVPWFVPPASVDATKRPRRGGRPPHRIAA